MIITKVCEHTARRVSMTERKFRDFVEQILKNNAKLNATCVVVQEVGGLPFNRDGMRNSVAVSEKQSEDT